MYQSFYGLTDKPFSMLPDPAFLFLGKKHQTALTLLEYGLFNKAGFCVISGETGAGKTTLLRQLLKNVDENVVVGMITNTHQSFGTLLDWVLSAFNIHQPNMDKVEMHQLFVDFLLEQYAKNKTTLLIVDEAQNLPTETLEELRMLSNVNSEKDQVLQVILAGQPQLKNTLRQPELMQFAQRIAVDYHLDSLGAEETCGYIQHRLKTSGATKDIFTAEACVRIHDYSGGIPRLINLICDTVLVYGFADQNLIITKELIDEMVSERMKDSVVPILDVSVIDKIRNSEVGDLDFDFPSIAVNETSAADADEVAQDLSENDLESADEFYEDFSSNKINLDQIKLSERDNNHSEDVSQPVDAVTETESIEQVDKEDTEEKEDDSPQVFFAEEDNYESDNVPVATQIVDGGEKNSKTDSDTSLLLAESANKPVPFLYKARYLIAVLIVAVLLITVYGWEKIHEINTAEITDKKTEELKQMLSEVEQTKKELEALKSKEAERMIEMALIKSQEIQRKSDESLEKARLEEKRIADEKLRAMEELKIAREKAIRAEKRIDEMFKQRKIEEQRRHNQLLAREKELEKKREEIAKIEQKEAEKRAEIQANFDAIDSRMDLNINEGIENRNAEKAKEPEVVKKPKSFVTDPCSSSSARFLSTCR